MFQIYPWFPTISQVLYKSNLPFILFFTNKKTYPKMEYVLKYN